MDKDKARREILKTLQRKSNTAYTDDTMTTAIQQIFREDALSALRKLELEGLDEVKVVGVIGEGGG